MAGMISRTATAPLDRLKVYLIAQTSPKAAAVDAAKKGAPVAALRSFGRPLVDACKDLWAAGGIRSLFAGNGLNVAKVMPESAIKFGAYEAAKRFFARIDGSDPKHLHPTAQFLAGGFGGVVSQCIVYPLDTLKLFGYPALPFGEALPEMSTLANCPLVACNAKLSLAASTATHSSSRPDARCGHRAR
jgi:solute carrier family 25 (mitochondrial phosphate transporter), member 23/24/25/41